MWWRSGDGDLADELITARMVLSDTGFVWLMTPKPARPDHVDAAEVTEAGRSRRTARHVQDRPARRAREPAHPVQLHPPSTHDRPRPRRGRPPVTGTADRRVSTSPGKDLEA
ncbi:DUF3052 family protein [Rhodococcus sp. 3A]|uniref:DUF3052 family protein n=1 Tax=Rhodococcus sp. 3A TaxID=2834581 RepID=UPI002078CAE0|nr:DUF3052 family protein [Rhodococcus sp. 3A]